MKMKRQVGNCNKTRRLVTRQSPPSVGWSSMGLRWWKGGPLRAILEEILEDKKFKTEKGMKKKIRQLWDELDSSLLHNLIDSIPDRLRRIRKAKGGSIKAIK